MKRALWIPALFLIFAFRGASAEILPLFTREMPAAELLGFDQSVNRSSSIYVWQNDPGLLESGASVSRLCTASALASALIHEYAKRSPRISNLRLPGLSPDGRSIDTAILVRTLDERCNGGGNGGQNPIDAARCMKDFYRGQGLPESEVTLIRNLGFQPAIAGVRYESRKPGIQDLQEALKSGSEVIAAFAFMQWDRANRKWIKKASHSVNLTGYAWNEEERSSRMALILQDPTRRYTLDFATPVYDVAMLEVAPDADPAPYSNLELTGIKGDLLNREGTRTFLAGLLILRPGSGL